jgi:hypothetical protein
MERCEQLGLTGVDFHRIGIPDEYVHHGAQDVLRAQYDLHAEGIAKRAREFFDGKDIIEQGNRSMETIGDLADAMAAIRERAPEGAFRDLPTSDSVDAVVYGLPRRVTAK